MRLGTFTGSTRNTKSAIKPTMHYFHNHLNKSQSCKACQKTCNNSKVLRNHYYT